MSLYGAGMGYLELGIERIEQMNTYKISLQVYTGKNMFRSNDIKEVNFIPQIGWNLKIPKVWEDDPDNKSRSVWKNRDGVEIKLVKVKAVTYNAIEDFFQVDCCTLESEKQYIETFGE